MLDQNRKDCLIFSMVQCATNYSDWDVQMVFSVLDTEETKFANEYLFNHNLGMTNDKRMRLIAIIQDLRDQKVKLNSQKLCQG